MKEVARRTLVMHKRTLMLYLCVVAASMSIASSVAAVGQSHQRGEQILCIGSAAHACAATNPASGRR